MTILVIAEHDNSSLKRATLNAVTAAAAAGNDIHLLVAGHGAAAVAEQAAKVAGVAEVLVADAAEYAHGLPENLAALVVSLASSYTHVIAASTAVGKNFMPRVAALLDSAQISDVVAFKAPDVFVRPIYAGNALATVQSSDAIKVITIRPTVFDAAATGSAAAPTRAVASAPAFDKARFVGQELTK
jgi:electron transfer flavoprotein alpha subunit